MSNANQDLMPTTPEEALDLYLRERSTDVTESTLQAHEYRLNHFVRWCNGEGEIENVNTLTGRELHRYKLWRQEDGDLNKVSLKSQMDTLYLTTHSQRNRNELSVVPQRIVSVLGKYTRRHSVVYQGINGFGVVGGEPPMFEVSS